MKLSKAGPECESVYGGVWASSTRHLNSFGFVGCLTTSPTVWETGK